MPFQLRHLGTALAGVLAAVLILFAATLPGRAAEGAPLTIVAFGDSLTAGYRLPEADAFPTVLQAALRARGWNVTIVNAGVSGDTASAAAARLDWSVPDGTDGVLVEVGANDMLRGIDPAITRAALDGILGRLKARGIPALVLGMYASRTLGADYVAAFERIYPELARKWDDMLYPFFLDGVAQQPALNLDDGMHPNAEGVRVIVARMLPTVEAFLRTLSGNG